MHCIVQLNSGYWKSEFLMKTPLNTLKSGFIKEAKLSYANQVMLCVYLSH